MFNYRLSRARLVVECAFGILTKKWKILESAIDFKLQTTETIVMALICLHNFIITEETDFHDDVDNNANHKNGIGIYQGLIS